MSDMDFSNIILGACVVTIIYGIILFAKNIKGGVRWKL